MDLRCKSCGAVLKYEGKETITCEYCQQVTLLDRDTVNRLEGRTGLEGVLQNVGKAINDAGSSFQEGLKATAATNDPNASSYSRLVALLLCVFLGGLGAHRFYVGKIGSGVLWLLTVGLCGIGTLIDIIQLANESFTDKNGKIVKNWSI